MSPGRGDTLTLRWATGQAYQNWCVWGGGAGRGRNGISRKGPCCSAIRLHNTSLALPLASFGPQFTYWYKGGPGEPVRD